MKLQNKLGIFAASIVGIIGVGILSMYYFAPTEGIKVFKSADRTNWPLMIDSGTIYCQWKELIPSSDYRHAKRPLVLFEFEQGIYGVNGAASGTGGYPPIERIMVEKRLWQYGASAVVNEWIQAGIELCNGNKVEAQYTIRSANAKAAKPLPKGVDVELRTDTISTNRRSIFLQTIKCEDRAIEESFKGHQERLHELIRSGRKKEALELNRQRIKKESQLMATCKSRLREQVGLSVDEHRKIMAEGLSRGWPTE